MNKKHDKNFQPVTVYLTKEQYHKIKKICELEGLKISHIVIKNIELFIAEKESIIEEK